MRREQCSCIGVEQACPQGAAGFAFEGKNEYAVQFGFSLICSLTFVVDWVLICTNIRLLLYIYLAHEISNLLVVQGSCRVRMMNAILKQYICDWLQFDMI